MIEARMLSLWDGLVGSVTLIAITILALCVMVGTVPKQNVMRHLGLIVATAILLVMLPAIIAALWNSLTTGQHLGMAMVLMAIIFLISSVRRKSTKVRH